MAVRVGSLLRLSEKKQAIRQGSGDLDIVGQRKEIGRFIESRMGWRLVKEFSEVGSAYKNKRSDRDVLTDVVESATRREFDVLVVWKLDRLSRRMVDTPAIVADLNELGIEIWSVVDAPGGMKVSAENAMETLMLVLHGFKNEKESEDISLRVKTRARQLAGEGRWLGSKVPFGYQLVARKDSRGEPVLRGGRVVRDLVPHPEWAPVVREAYNRYLAGSGYLRLAEWLNTRGIRTYQGAVWSQNSVRDLIANPIYCGQIVTFRTEGVPRSKARRVGADPVRAKGQHEALVSEETWLEAQRLRAARTSLPKRQRSSDYALVGVVRCGACGGPMGATTRRYRRTNGEHVAYPVYICLKHKNAKQCVVTSHKAVDVEAGFLSALEEQFTAPKGIRQYLEEQEQTTREALQAMSAARRRMQERVKTIDGALRELNRAYLEARTITDSEYADQKATYLAERQRLEEELGRPVQKEEVRDVSALVELVSQFRVNWEDPGTTPEERKALALNLIKGWDLRVLIHPDGKVEIIPIAV